MSEPKKNLAQKIEALLFIAGRPLTKQKMAAVVKAKEEDVANEVDVLQKRYEEQGSGLALVKVAQSYQLTTAKETSGTIADFIKEEVSGELTKPSLEALTIIAYRGPVKKAEVEQIRGVNCSVIIRNLLIRGLIEEETRKGDVSPSYSVTADFLKYIGLTKIEDLPQYESLSSNVPLEKFLSATNDQKE